MAKKILIIEDDKFLRRVIARKLAGEGYEIIEALDGEKGLKSAQDEKPDIILLDLILPGIDGFEVLSGLKQNSSTANIPIMILSNLGQKEDIDKGMKMGAIDYLIKAHFTPGEIAERIEKILK